jgi:hypothetical protein
MLSRIAAFIDAGVQVGVAAFACTPDAFGDLLAVAIDGGDVAAWAHRATWPGGNARARRSWRPAGPIQADPVGMGRRVPRVSGRSRRVAGAGVAAGWRPSPGWKPRRRGGGRNLAR